MGIARWARLDAKLTGTRQRDTPVPHCGRASSMRSGAPSSPTRALDGIEVHDCSRSRVLAIDHSPDGTGRRGSDRGGPTSGPVRCRSPDGGRSGRPPSVRPAAHARRLHAPGPGPRGRDPVEVRRRSHAQHRGAVRPRSADCRGRVSERCRWRRTVRRYETGSPPMTIIVRTGAWAHLVEYDARTRGARGRIPTTRRQLPANTRIAVPAIGRYHPFDATGCCTRSGSVVGGVVSQSDGADPRPREELAAARRGRGSSRPREVHRDGWAPAANEGRVEHRRDRARRPGLTSFYHAASCTLTIR